MVDREGFEPSTSCLPVGYPQKGQELTHGVIQSHKVDESGHGSGFDRAVPLRRASHLIARTHASWLEASQFSKGLRAKRSLARQKAPWLKNRSRLYHPQE